MSNVRPGDGVEQFASYMYGLEMQDGHISGPDLTNIMPTTYEDDASGVMSPGGTVQPHQYLNNAHDTIEGIIFDAIKAPQSGFNKHSVAIPIQAGKRSPLYSPTVSKYMPTVAVSSIAGANNATKMGSVRLGGMAMFATEMPGSASSTPAGGILREVYFPNEPNPCAGIPMPSPINNSAAVGGAGAAPMYFHYAQSLPIIDERAASPPMSRSFAATARTPSMGTSPRSLNDSMFSFRAGSLSTAEQQIEKQKRRKENHNAVERRRRDLINNMISQLALIVSATPAGLEPAVASKMNKGEVLESSVRRILLLNNALAEVASQLTVFSRDNPVLIKYGELIASLVTQLPEPPVETTGHLMLDQESAET